MHFTFLRLLASASCCSTMQSWWDTASRRLSCIFSTWADLWKTPTQSTGKTALSHSSSLPWYSSHGQDGFSPSPSVVRARSKEAFSWPLDGNWSLVKPLDLSVGVAWTIEAMGVFADLLPCLHRVLLPSDVEINRQAPSTSE